MQSWNSDATAAAGESTIDPHDGAAGRRARKPFPYGPFGRGCAGARADSGMSGCVAHSPDAALPVLGRIRGHVCGKQCCVTPFRLRVGVSDVIGKQWRMVGGGESFEGVALGPLLSGF